MRTAASATRAAGDPDVARRRLVRDEGDRMLDRGGDRHLLRGWFARAARRREELADDRLDSLDLLDDQLHLLGDERTVSAELRLHDLQIALDDRDRVVDLVRDSGGQLAEGGELLGCDELAPGVVQQGDGPAPASRSSRPARAYGPRSRIRGSRRTRSPPRCAAARGSASRRSAAQAPRSRRRSRSSRYGASRPARMARTTPVAAPTGANTARAPRAASTSARSSPATRSVRAMPSARWYRSRYTESTNPVCSIPTRRP